MIDLTIYRLIANQPTPQYTYEVYIAIHNKLGGRTIHYSDGVLRDLQKELLTLDEFEQKLSRLTTLMAKEPEGPDEMESAMYEIHDLESDLLLCERLNPFYDWKK